MAILFDAIILYFLILDGIGIVLAIKMAKRTKKRRSVLLARLGAFLLAVGWLVVFYGSYIEPQIILTQRQTIRLAPNPTQMIRVALIGDLHVGPYKQSAFVQRVVEKVMAEEPDIILIAGDSISDSDEQVRHLEPLKNLTAQLGVFGILGNHDYGVDRKGRFEHLITPTAVAEKLQSLHIRMLINESVALKKGSSKFILAGTDEWWMGRADIDRALEKILPTQRAVTPTILVSHNPDIVTAAAQRGIDLVLAAHTHGGQIRLPFLGPVPPIPDELGRRFDRGLFQFGNTQLFITGGLGESGPRARLLVPPEVAMLEIEL